MNYIAMYYYILYYIMLYILYYYIYIIPDITIYINYNFEKLKIEIEN